MSNRLALMITVSVLLLGFGAVFTLATDSGAPDHAKEAAPEPGPDPAAPVIPLLLFRDEPKSCEDAGPQENVFEEVRLNYKKCCACVFQCANGGHFAFFMPEEPGELQFLRHCRRNTDCRDMRDCPPTATHHTKGTCGLKENSSAPRCAHAICHTIPPE